MPLEILRWAHLRNAIFLPRLCLEFAEALWVASLLLQIYPASFLSCTPSPDTPPLHFHVRGCGILSKMRHLSWSLPQSTTL